MKKLIITFMLLLSTLLLCEELSVKNMYAEFQNIRSDEEAIGVLQKYAKSTDIETLKTVQGIWLMVSEKTLPSFAENMYNKQKKSVYATYFYARQLKDTKKQYKLAVKLIEANLKNIDAYLLLGEIYVTKLFENFEENDDKSFLTKKYKSDKSKLDFIFANAETNYHAQEMALSHMLYLKQYQQLKQKLTGNEQAKWYSANLHATALAALKSYDDAKAIYKKQAKAKKYEEPYASAHPNNKLSQVLYMLKNYDAIHALYKDATNYFDLYNYSVILAKMGKTKKAIEYLSKASKAGFNHPIEIYDNPAFDEIRTAKKFTKVYNEIFAKTIINKPAYKWELKGADGKIVKLADLKGKIVVLDFWATWCGPCRMAMPVLNEWMKNKPDNVEVFSINVWEKKPEDAVKYMKDNNFLMTYLLGQENLSEKYEFNGIPYICVIDQKGNIMFEERGFSDSLGKNLDLWVEYLNKK